MQRQHVFPVGAADRDRQLWLGYVRRHSRRVRGRHRCRRWCHLDDRFGLDGGNVDHADHAFGGALLREHARRGQVEGDRSGGDDGEHACGEHRQQCLALGPRGTHAVEQVVEDPLFTGAEVLGECGDVRTAKRDGRLALLAPNLADQHQVVVQQRLAVALAIGGVHRAGDELAGRDDEWGAVERLCGGHGSVTFSTVGYDSLRQEVGRS